jgi:hypothetical protein
MTKMNLLLAKKYWMNVIFKDNQYGSSLELTVYVESRTGKVNANTGSVIPVEDLDEAVNESVIEITGKSIYEIKGLAYLPHTLEMMIIRLWENIDEALGYRARLTKLRLAHNNNSFFVEYSREEEQQPQPQPQPQYKRAKRRS